MKWSVRELLNPVATRTLLYGADPFDLEYILGKLDGIKVRSGRQIQEIWLGEWQKKLERYSVLRDKAERSGNTVSAAEYARMAVQCHYARFMINIEDAEHKAEIYRGLDESYRRYAALRRNRTEYTEINTEYGRLPAYIHYPDSGDKKSYPAAVTYSGIGSCKEELDMLAGPLSERGIAVIAPDMPGAGGALIYNNIKCGGRQIEAAFEGIYRFIEDCPKLDADRLANYGLCMGGGYAFRATVKYPKTRACVSLFPLLMNFADQSSIPVWMKRGKWSSYQYSDDFLEGMKALEEGTHSSDFLMVYSSDDNWMAPEASQRLLEKAKGYRECIHIEDKPAYISEETIMHAMPVGEQYHWIKHIAADFIAERLNR